MFPGKQKSVSSKQRFLREGQPWGVLAGPGAPSIPPH